MRIASAAIVFLCLYGLSGCSEPPEPSSSVTLEVDTDVTAIVNVNVVPMTAEHVLVEHTVLVEEGRISAVGPAAEITVPTQGLANPCELECRDDDIHVPSITDGDSRLVAWLWAIDGLKLDKTQLPSEQK